MLRPARLLSPACAAATLTMLVAPWAVPSAVAEETEGTITVVVNLDLDGNGSFDNGTDPVQPGIGITVTDAKGTAYPGSTDEKGQFVVVPAEHALRGGRYFVVADIPGPLGLVPVAASDSFQPFSTTVDVSTGDQTVRLGVATRPAVASTAPEPPAAPDPPPEPPPSPARPAPEPRFAVGDRVWSDLDRQGRQDAKEAGVGGISVQLLDADGTVLDSTRTDGDGRYLFDDLAAGLYSVRFAGIESESRLSLTGVGNGSGDSDPDYTGVTPPFELAPGAPDVRPVRDGEAVRADYVNLSVDAGIAPLTYAVASVVWQDQDGDGLQDADEPAAPARVTLVDTDRDRTVASVRTDDSGRYLFAALPRGSYRLEFDDLGDHRRLTRPRVGGNPAMDSDPDAAGRSKGFRLEAGVPALVPAADVGSIDADFVDTTHSAGVVGSYVITNRVWDDSNGDGTLSAGEDGIPDVVVELLDLSGDVVASTRTSADGTYRFDVPAGDYRLSFSGIPKGLHPTTPGVGGDRGVDSDLYADLLTPPISVGEDHPVEDGVSAGLTTAAGSTATTPAPSTASPVVTSSVAEPLRSTGRPAPELPVLPVAGVLLVMLAAVLGLRRRLRRR